MLVNLGKTKLKDRTLWYDGDISIPASSVMEMISNRICDNRFIFIDNVTPEIEEYNRLTLEEDEKFTVKKQAKPFNFDWNIPQEYKDLNLNSYVLDKFFQECDKNEWLDDEKHSERVKKRVERIAKELKLFQKFQIVDLVKALIFMINTFESNNIVWGVGRGSSVSSYVLYLIGVHDIDSVEYDLDENEFFHSS